MQLLRMAASRRPGAVQPAPSSEGDHERYTAAWEHSGNLFRRPAIGQQFEVLTSIVCRVRLKFSRKGPEQTASNLRAIKPRTSDTAASYATESSDKYGAICATVHRDQIKRSAPVQNYLKHG